MEGRIQELYLGRNGLKAVEGFEKYPSLESLWLNNNELVSLVGLEENFRIKYLYVHFNKLRRLSPDSLTHCTFLSHLTLNDNLLDDIDNVLTELRPCHHLNSLDLFNNPVAQEDTYRLKVIGELPWVQVLDRHEVTDDERLRASLLKEKLASTFALASKVVKPPKYSPQEIEHRSLLLQTAQRRIRDATLKSRILLELVFKEYDKRYLGYLPSNVVLDCLGQTGLNGLLCDEERAVLFDTYSKPLSLEAIAPGHKIRKNLFHYRQLCEDVLAPELRLFEDEKYQVHPCPEITKSTKNLMQYVATAKSREKRQSDMLHRSTTSASSSNIAEKVFTGSSAAKPKYLQHGHLSPFTAGEISKIIKETQRSAENNTLASVNNVETIFKKALGFGLVPDVGIKAAAESVVSGQGQAPWTTVFDALGAASISSGAPIIKWRQLEHGEVKTVELRYAEDGGRLIDMLMSVRTSSKENADLMSRTLQAGTVITRLASFQGTASKHQQSLKSPQESSDARSDFFVLPKINVEERRILQV